MEYLRPQEIAKRLGSSVNFVSKLIHKSKPREQKEEGKKTLFCYEDITDFVKKQV